MKAVVARPGKRLVHELRGLVLALIMPVAMLLVFPYSAIGWKAVEKEPAARSFCAFVTLSADEEYAAMEAARSVWKTETKGVGSLRADLSVTAIPEETRAPVVGARIVVPAVRPVGKIDLAPLPGTLAAPRAERLPSAENVPQKTETTGFAREELLKID